MVQSLLGIATFVAVIGSVIFGVKQFEKKSQRDDQQEQVDQPIGEAIVNRSTEVKELSFNEMFPDVENDLEMLQPNSLIEAEAPSKEAVSLPAEEILTKEEVAALQLDSIEPIEENSALLQLDSIEPNNAENFVVLQLDAIEPSNAAEEVLTPATIHEPKRSTQASAEDLSQEILAWGQSKDLKYLPKLFQAATHREAMVRETVAIAIGKIVAHRAVRGDVERAIPVLGKLTQDSNLQVRQFAVQALGQIRSEKVLPYLQRSLQSPAGKVKQAANSALQNLKLNYYGETPAMQIAKKMTEKRQGR